MRDRKLPGRYLSIIRGRDLLHLLVRPSLLLGVAWKPLNNVSFLLIVWLTHFYSSRLSSNLPPFQYL